MIPGQSTFIGATKIMVTRVPTVKKESRKRATTPSKTSKKANSNTQSNRAISWDLMKFWTSPEWGRVQAKLSSTPEGMLVPDRRLIFRPFIETPLPKVKVVFLGREPFNGRWTNDGLAYSSSSPIFELEDASPPFQVIAKEAMTDVGIPVPKVATLRNWARQGVLMWNTLPTIRRGYSLSHINIGWEELTEEIIETAYLQNPKCVFVIFDNVPAALRHLLPGDASCVFAASPSKWGGGFLGGFSGSRIFSRTNTLLRATGQQPIDWRIK